MLWVSTLQFVSIVFLSVSLVLDELMVSYQHKSCPIRLAQNYHNKSFQHSVSVKNLRVQWGYTSVAGSWNDGTQSNVGDINYMQTYQNLYNIDCKHNHNDANSSSPSKSPTPAPTPKPSKSPKLFTSNQDLNLSPQNSVATITHEQSETSEASDKNAEIIENDVGRNRRLLGSAPHLPRPTRKGNETNLPTNAPSAPSTHPTIFATVNVAPSPAPTAPTAPTPLPTVTLYQFPTASPTESLETACDDLQVVIITGKTYVGLVIGGLCLIFLSMVGSIVNTCQLASIEYRRKIRQIVIVLNIISFMALMLAFAMWIGFFSNNINDVLQTDKNTFAFCVLKNPDMGLSVIFLITSWIVIGFVSIIACYCGNRPHGWYTYLRRVRHGIDANKLHADGSLDSPGPDGSEEAENMAYYNGANVMRFYGNNAIPVDSRKLYDENGEMRSGDDIDEDGVERPNNSSNGSLSLDARSSNNGSASMAGAANYDVEYRSSAYGRSTRHRKRSGYRKGMMDEVHPQYSPLLN